MKPGAVSAPMGQMLLLAVFCAFPVAAQIRIDASLGRPPQTLSGPDYLIPEMLGKLSGNNLFHSFQTFNVQSGQSARFNTVTPGIARVISRVTGGEPSQINGKIQLSAVDATPDFYFINPAGVVFGAGAALDVPGAFLVSTADSVKFSEGYFNADLRRASTFSSAAPEAFGFLGTTRAAITLKDGAVLAAQSSRPISLSAGDVHITAATISSAQGGELRIAALGQAAQEVPFSGDLPRAAGTLAILSGGLLKTSGSESANGGPIMLSAGEINIDSQGSGQLTGLLSQSNSGDSTAAGDIRVTANGPLSVMGDSQIASVTYGAGKAGAIRVDAARAYLDGQGKGDESEPTGILSLAGKGSSGNAGRVEIAVTEHLSIRKGSVIASDINAGSSGNAGNVHVHAGSIAIERQGARFTGISSDANTASKGNAGSVEVATTGALSLVNGGVITSITDASGNSGSVKVSADSMLIDRQGGRYTGIFSDAENESSGNAGYVEVVVAGHLLLLNGGHIGTDTNAAGNAGTVKVSALNLTMNRQGGTRFTGISSDANPGSTGHAGSVEVAVGERLAILKGAVISSDTYASGNAGNVSASAGNLTIDGQGAEITGILSDAKENSSGRAGNVEVLVSGNLSLLGGGQISSVTYSSGQAGAVRVSAGTLLLDGVKSAISASAEALSSGQTGNVSVTATDTVRLANGAELSIRNNATTSGLTALLPTVLTVSSPDLTLNNAQISAASSGNIAASDLQINVFRQLLLERSRITTSANLGNGGSINIRGGGLVRLDNAQMTTSVSGHQGNGGDIDLNARALILNSGFIQANTAASNASGGQVGIDVIMLLPSANTLFLGGALPLAFQADIFGFNVIQAAAPTGVSGNIQIARPQLDLSGSLAGLSSELIDSGGLGRSPCQTSGGSSLSLSGRGGLPPSARGLLRSESAQKSMGWPMNSPRSGSASSGVGECP